MVEDRIAHLQNVADQAQRAVLLLRLLAAGGFMQRYDLADHQRDWLAWAEVEDFVVGNGRGGISLTNAGRVRASQLCSGRVAEPSSGSRKR